MGLLYACCLDLYSLVHKKFLYRISSYQMPLLSLISLCKQTDLAKGMTERIWTASAESQWFYSLHLEQSCQGHCCCLLLASGLGSGHPPTCYKNVSWTTVSVCWCSMDKSIWVINFHFLIEVFLRDSLKITLNAFSYPILKK